MSLTPHANLSHLSATTRLTNSYFSKYLKLGMVCTTVTLMMSLTGCNTTHEFKPTASVIVGAHKSL